MPMTALLRRAALVLALLASLASAQQICVHDADGDGHPLFGHTKVRTGVEVHKGRNFVSTSTSIDFADFDRDGRVDVIATNVKPHSLSNQEYYLTILRGRGDGDFITPPALYMAGNEATDVITGDFNNDGWPDAATANGFGNSIGIHLNARDGTLLERVEYAAGTEPRSLRAADFDGDGDLDVATMNCLSHDVSLFLNRGDGTFEPERRTFVGSLTQRGDPNRNFAYPGPFLAVGDFDGDGDADVAVPAGSRVKLLFNDGHGHLTLSPTVLTLPGTAYALVAADVDRDGRDDLALTILGQTRVAILRTLGGGLFAPAAIYDATNLPDPCPGCWFFAPTIAAGDLEGDGYPDLAVGHESWWPGVTVLRNRGDGTYLPKELYDADDNPRVVRLRDVNADGRDDLLSACNSLRTFAQIQLTDTAFRPMTYSRFPTYNPMIGPPSQGWYTLANEDLDGDGDQDLAVGTLNSSFHGNVIVLRNDAGALVPLPPIAFGPAGTATSEDVAIGDVNGDGRPDIVVADAVEQGGFATPGKFWVLLNQGSLSFTVQPPYLLKREFPIRVNLSDLDLDGDLDAALWTIDLYPGDDLTPVDRRITTYLNDGQGIFTPHSAAVFNTAPWMPRGDLAVGDLNGDGLPDLVASSGPRFYPTGHVGVQLNLGQGAFAPVDDYTLANSAKGLAILDFNRDGRQDVMVSHYFDGPSDVVLTAMFGDGDGAFPTRAEHEDPDTISGGAIASYPDAADGEPLLALPHDYALIHTLLRSGPWTFAGASAGYPTNFSEGAVIADFNNDGRPDIARVVSGQGNGVMILFNRSRRLPCYPNCDGLTSPTALNVRDFMCFINAFASGDPYANCDRSTVPPILTVADFPCFLNAFIAGCP